MAVPAAVLSVLVRANTKLAEAQLMRFNEKLVATEGRASKATTALAGVAKAGLAAGAVLGIAAVKQASDFEQAMLLVHTQAGATRKEVDRLRGSVLKLANDSEFSPKELADGLFRVESAGFRGRKAIDLLRRSVDLAEVGQSDLEQTTKALTGAMRSGIRGTETAAKTVGVLNAAVGQGSLRMEDLVGALSTGVLPAARAFGLGLKDVTSALDVLTAAGIPAQAGATRLRMTFSLMGAPTDKAKKALASIGLEQDSLAKAMRGPGGFIDAIVMLQEHLQGVSKTDQAAIISRAFGGGRSSSTVLTLLQNVDRLRKVYEATGDAAGDFGKSVREQAETPSEKFRKAINRINVLLINLGSKIAPVAAKAIDRLTSIISDPKLTVSDKFAKIVDLITNTISQNIGKVVEAGASIAAALARGFLNFWNSDANPLTKILTTAVLIRLVGGKGALGATGGSLLKLLGLGKGGAKGGLGGAALSSAKPVNVFVTNPGFGGVGSKGGAPTVLSGGGKGVVGKGGLAALTGAAGVGGVLGGAAIAALTVGVIATGMILTKKDKRTINERTGIGSQRGAGAKAEGHRDKMPGFIADPRAEGDRLKESISRHEAWSRKVREVTKANSEAYRRNGDVQTKVMSKSARDLADLRMTTARETKKIRDRFDNDTAKGRDALRRHYQEAAAAARTQMERTGTVTAKGLQFIRNMFIAELATYGVSRAEAGASFKQNKNRLDAHMPLRGDYHPGKQHGGAIVPGYGSGDKVPLAVGGRTVAMVEPHEGVYVVNRNAQQALSALNGAVPRFASGGGLQPGISKAMSAVLGKFPGLSVTSTTGGNHAKNSLHYSGNAVDLASGNYPYMNQAAAWIRKRFGRSLAEGIHNPNLSIKSGQPVSPGFWGADTWAQHANHIHLAVLGALKSLGLGRAHIKRVLVSGQDSPLKAIAQGGLDKVRAATNRKLARLTASSGMDSSFNGSLGGFSKGKLKRLWKAAGGAPNMANTMAAIALAESGGNPKAYNPSGASGLWQILGQIVPGNIFNPMVNAKNAIAKLSSQGLGAWVVYTSGAYKKFLKRGGPLGLQGGGSADPWSAVRPSSGYHWSPGDHMGGGKQGKGGGQLWKRIESTMRKIRKSDKPKIRHKALKHLMKGISGIEVPNLDRIHKLQKDSGKYDELANRASELSELLAPGEYQNFTVDQLRGLASAHWGSMPERQQQLLDFSGRSIAQLDEGALNELLSTPVWQKVQGKTQVEWLESELETMRVLRNLAIRTEGRIEDRRDRVIKLIDRVRDQIRAINEVVSTIGHLERALDKAKDLSGKHAPAGARKIVANLKGKIIPSVWRSLNKAVHGDNPAAGLVGSLKDNLKGLRGTHPGRVKNALQTVLGDEGSGLIGRRNALTSALTGDEGVRSMLTELQGSVPDKLRRKIFGPGKLPALGVLGGSIFDVQKSLHDLGVKHVLTVPQADESAGSERAELLATLLREANLRTAVSQAQYDVFRSMPFAGSFGAGGVIPGPIGRPMAAVVHGGETVSPVGATSYVEVNLGPGMEWLDRYIEVKVNGQTRKSAGPARSPLPGRGGGLQRRG